MKDNKEILNEAFFNRAKGIDKTIQNLPTYAPIEKGGNAFQVTDTDEVKKRLSGAFGVTFGNNNVKSMASRAIKSFPIVISENVDPETAVMLKRLMEEQYADYINLLVSNQVVDLADYKSSEDGNIAIQALDTLSGTDFSSTRIADKAATGKLSKDDVFRNMPLYSLLKEDKKELKSGNPILDALLEDAIVVPEEYTENLREFIEYYADEIEELNEATGMYVGDNPTSIVSKSSSYKATEGQPEVTTFDKYLMDLSNKDENTEDAIVTRDTISAYKRGLLGMDSKKNEIYNKLTTADIVIDPHMLDAAVNKSVGDILTDPANVEIRDRFEKATFLLQSRRISGMEYYQYLTLRLGIPVSDRARKELMQQFKVADIRQYGQGGTEYEGAGPYVISNDDREAIYKNRRVTGGIVRTICKTKLRRFLESLATGTVVSGATAGIGAAVALAWSLTPVGLFALGGALVGAGIVGIVHLIRRKQREKRKQFIDKAQQIEGWERVEALIDQIYATQNQFRNKLNAPDKPMYSDTVKFSSGSVKADMPSNDSFDVEENRRSLAELLKSTQVSIKESVLRESVDPELDHDTFDISMFLDENLQKELDETIATVSEEVEKDQPELYDQFLTESIFSKVFGKKKLGGGTMPVEVKYIEKDKNKDVIIVPQFMAGQRFAYGSTEFERRDVKDRKYNQPIFMTIKFKERFSDGKISDNELTAVIGILGKIIRVPSEEMEYVLTENLNDNTIEGFLKDPNGSLNNMISDMIGAEKITREAKKLPQSAELWRNLEKVATLAAANKISGRKTNNIANAHIVFSQKEIDSVRNETGIDYLKNTKYGAKLMQRYSAFTLMVANDAGMRVYILDGKDSTSWEVVPYSALMGKDGGDQLNAALTKLARLSD